MQPAYQKFLPPDVPASSVRACLGLISDTHMPQRCDALPGVLNDVFSGVDLILHAGDVGELWVLDQLSAIAPVIAVHGNDETAEAQRELPYQQLVAVSGQRILLCHSHDPDHASEMELRKDDTWPPKLKRWLGFGQRAGASVMVFGHTHIPMTYRHNGNLLVNPGAIASGSAVSRQMHQSIALLIIPKDRPPVAVHVDLTAPEQPYVPEIDWNAGFRAALNLYNPSILDPALETAWSAYTAHVLNLLTDPANKPAFEALYAALLRVARPCWIDARRYLSRSDVLDALEMAALDPHVSESLVVELRSILI